MKRWKWGWFKEEWKMEFIMLLFVFLIFIVISSFLNIIFKLTAKRDWLMSLLLSIVLSIITVAILD